jgi:hypothetical protein
LRIVLGLTSEVALRRECRGQSDCDFDPGTGTEERPEPQKVIFGAANADSRSAAMGPSPRAPRSR